MTKRLMLSTSFSSKVDDDTGQVLLEFKTHIEDVLVALRQTGEFDIYCAVESENWIISKQPPEVGVEQDLSEIDKADIILTLLLDQPSWGTQYEMGYAVAKGKRVIAATAVGVSLAYFYQGLAKLDQITHVVYDSPTQLAEKVALAF